LELNSDEIAEMHPEDRAMYAQFQHDGLARFVGIMVDLDPMLRSFYEHIMLNISLNLAPVSDEFINRMLDHNPDVRKKMHQNKAAERKTEKVMAVTKDRAMVRNEKYQALADHILDIMSMIKCYGRNILFAQIEEELSTRTFGKYIPIAEMDCEELDAMSLTASVYEREGL
jgi:hypothetical protein